MGKKIFVNPDNENQSVEIEGCKLDKKPASLIEGLRRTKRDNVLKRSLNSET